MALTVQLVVGKLQLVEGDHMVHPVRSQCGGLRVNVEPGVSTGLLKTLHPLRVLILVAMLIDGNKIHQQHIERIWVEIMQFHFQCGEHPSIRQTKKKKGSKDQHPKS